MIAIFSAVAHVFRPICVLLLVGASLLISHKRCRWVLNIVFYFEQKCLQLVISLWTVLPLLNSRHNKKIRKVKYKIEIIRVVEYLLQSSVTSVFLN